MSTVRIVMLILAVVLAGKAVSMLPPDTFKGPLFAEGDKSGESSEGEYTEFA